MIMETMQIDILDPKAVKLLQDLADLNLISIRLSDNNSFMDIVKKLRASAGDNPPTLDEITEEVEAVRAERYARSKK